MTFTQIRYQRLSERNLLASEYAENSVLKYRLISRSVPKRGKRTRCELMFDPVLERALRANNLTRARGEVGYFKNQCDGTAEV